MAGTRQELEGRSVAAGGVTVRSASSWSEPRTISGRLGRILALEDFEPVARRHLPRPIFGFISGGAETNTSLIGNRAAFGDYRFIPRALIDAEIRSTETELFGRRYAAPFGIPPMGASALVAHRGDEALARGAAASGIPYVLSASALMPMEEIARANPEAWFQAYLPGDDDRILAQVDRAGRAGFGTFVLTVDLPVPGNRENNVRNGFSLPLRPSLRLACDGITRPRWLFGTAARTLLGTGMPHFENLDAKRGPPILSREAVRQTGARAGLAWEHVALIRRHWPGTFVLKGILAAEDARLAREHGVNGVVLSNHGGRQLDGSMAPLHALPAVVPQAAGMTVMIDGGIRRGTDVLKALALGAHFVWVGRPFLYAAAIGGEAGVRHAATLLAEEVDRNLALLGISSPAEMKADLLTPARPI